MTFDYVFLQNLGFTKILRFTFKRFTCQSRLRRSFVQWMLCCFPLEYLLRRVEGIILKFFIAKRLQPRGLVVVSFAVVKARFRVTHVTVQQIVFEVSGRCWCERAYSVCLSTHFNMVKYDACLIEKT